jgi:hypothetical protein
LLITNCSQIEYFNKKLSPCFGSSSLHSLQFEFEYWRLITTISMKLQGNITISSTIISQEMNHSKWQKWRANRNKVKWFSYNSTLHIHFKTDRHQQCQIKRNVHVQVSNCFSCHLYESYKIRETTLPASVWAQTLQTGILFLAELLTALINLCCFFSFYLIFSHATQKMERISLLLGLHLVFQVSKSTVLKFYLL